MIVHIMIDLHALPTMQQLLCEAEWTKGGPKPHVLQLLEKHTGNPWAFVHATRYEIVRVNTSKSSHGFGHQPLAIFGTAPSRFVEDYQEHYERAAAGKYIYKGAGPLEFAKRFGDILFVFEVTAAARSKTLVIEGGMTGDKTAPESAITYSGLFERMGLDTGYVSEEGSVFEIQSALEQLAERHGNNRAKIRKEFIDIGVVAIIDKSEGYGLYSGKDTIAVLDKNAIKILDKKPLTGEKPAGSGYKNRTTI